MRFSPLHLLAVIGLAFLLWSPSANATATRYVSAADWEPRPGDFFYVDVSANWGYLIHKDTDEVQAFPVATGQKRFVWWIGRYYHAATPLKTSIVTSTKIQPNRVVFGPTGLFLRLGDTPYGIHTYNKDEWLDLPDDERYKSMGCIVPSATALAAIYESYKLNGERLVVITNNVPWEAYRDTVAAKEVAAKHF